MKLKLDNYGPRRGTSWLEDDSYIQMDGVEKQRFDIEENVYKITKRRKLKHYINDVHASNIQMKISGLEVEISLFFETEGEEIKGRCVRYPLIGRAHECIIDLERDVHLRPQLNLSAKLVAYNGFISYEEPEVNFKTEVYIPNRLCRLFKDIRGRIEDIIQNQVTSLVKKKTLEYLNKEEAQDAVAKAIRNIPDFSGFINTNWTVKKIESRNQHFLVTVKK